MLLKRMTFSAAELNAGTVLADQIDTTNGKPTAVRVWNYSGADISFLVMTDSEYKAFQADESITDLVPVWEWFFRNIIDLKDGIEWVICQGSGAGHVIGVNIDITLE